MIGGRDDETVPGLTTFRISEEVAWNAMDEIRLVRRPGPVRAEGPSFWDSVRRVLPAVRAAMEYCWLYPWIVIIGGGLYPGQGPLISAVWAFLILMVAQAAVSPVLERGGSIVAARALLVGGGFVLGLVDVYMRYYSSLSFWRFTWLTALLTDAHAALPAVSQPVMGALVASLLWWRGLVLGGREVGAIEIEQAYKTGVAMIVVYFLAAAVYFDSSGFQAAGPMLPGTLPAFFFLGLSALALARLATIWDAGQQEEKAQFPARAWILLVIGLVGIILLVAGMTAGLAATDVTTYMGLALRPLLPLLEIVFYVMFIVATVLVRAIIFVLERLPSRVRLTIPTREPMPLDTLLERLRSLELNPQVIAGARWGMVLAVITLLVIGMAATIVLLRRRQRRAGDDERESVWSGRAAWNNLKNALRGLRIRRARSGEHILPTAAGIRMVYRELLEFGRDLGAVRPMWSTPREHDPRLRSVLAQSSDEVALLTHTYERVRYGGWTPTQTELHEARDTLARIKAAAEPRPADPAPVGASRRDRAVRTSGLSCAAMPAEWRGHPLAPRRGNARSAPGRAPAPRQTPRPCPSACLPATTPE